MVMLMETTSVAVLLFTASICEATLLSTTAQFTKGKVVATSYKTIQPFSEVQCVTKCFEDGRKGMCYVAGYNKVTSTCYLSVDREQDVLDVEDDMTGVFYINHGK